MTQKPIVVLDPSSTGHHPQFLRLLFEVAGGGGNCTFYVDEGLVESLSVSETGRVQSIQELGKNPAAQLNNLVRRNKSLNHIFLPRMNTYLQPLLQTSLPGMRVSGIWFSPQSAAWVHGGGLKKRMKGLLEILRMNRMVRQCGLEKLFILNDPATAAFLTRQTRIPLGVESLADPVPELPSPSAPRAELRRDLGISEEKTVFGLFGALREGKGMESAITAFSDFQPEARLLIAGEALPNFKPRLEKLLDSHSGMVSEGRLMPRVEKLTDQQLADYLEAVDYILLPYENVWGSSGFLGHGARSGKPVLAARQGLLGALVKRYRLGHVFDPGNPASWRAVLMESMDGLPSQDPDGVKAYLHDNSEESFQDTLTRYFLNP